MTPKEFEKRMKEIAESEGRYRDAENTHSEADELMETVLKELGYGDGVKIFREMDKWYA